jgi:inosine-uridine nucleoside N-ribohydrolase
LGWFPLSHDPVFIFTDPGIDDALALALAARSEKLVLLGACGVDGNIPSNSAISNLAALLKLFKAKGTPVFESSVDDPPHEYATHVHGKNGLGNVQIPVPSFKKRSDLVDFLKIQKRFQILSLGPLTAVAKLLGDSPEIADQISRCVIMGGGLSHGNVTPYAEFNIASNPEAADQVFRSALKKILIPLDVTEKVILDGEDLAELKKSKDRTTNAIAGMLRFYFTFEKKKRGIFGGFMHDPTAFVAMLHPEFFEFRQAEVRVDTSAKETSGQTIAKFSRAASANTWVALGVKAPSVRFEIKQGLLKQTTAKS